MSEPIHDTLLNLLVDRGLISREAQPNIEPLGWGISNAVLKVGVGDDSFVIKHPLPKTRVKDEWYFDQSRIVVEHDCMTLLSKLLPGGSDPKVRFCVLKRGWESRRSSAAGRSWSRRAPIKVYETSGSR